MHVYCCEAYRHVCTVLLILHGIFTNFTASHFTQKVEKCIHWFRVYRAISLNRCFLLKIMAIWNEWILLFLIFFYSYIFIKSNNFSSISFKKDGTGLTTQQINAYTDWMQSKNQLIFCQELIFPLFTKAFYWWLSCSRLSGCFWLFAPKFWEVAGTHE